MARAILRRRKRVKQQRTPLSFQTQTEIQVVQIRLRRAQDVLSALAYCADQGAELDLGPVAVAVRDQIDQALTGLASITSNAGMP